MDVGKSKGSNLLTLCAVFLCFECARARRMRLNSCVQNPSAFRVAVKPRRRCELEATLFWHAFQTRAGIGHTESGEREEHTRTSPFARTTSPRKQKIKEVSSRNLRIVLRFVLQREPHGLRSSRNETDNRFNLKGLAEREGFEPSVQVLARTTV
jgi:hypothetical protein